MKHITLFFITLLIMVYSCVDDKGSYDFVPVNQVMIYELTEDGDTVNGLRSWSKISMLDTLTYKVDLVGTLADRDLGSYDFEWYLCYNNHTHETLSRTKDLEYFITQSPGTYGVYFQVTDRETGMKWLASANLTVTSPTTRGFLILGDTEEGIIGLDMLAMPVDKDTTMVEGVFDNSVHRITDAEKLFFAGTYMGREDNQQALWITTKNGSYRLTNQDSIALMGTVEDVKTIEVVYDHKTPIKVMDMAPHQTTSNRSSSNRVYITEDFVFINGITMTEYFVTPINRYDATSETFFKPYPLAFCQGSYIRPQDFMFYDMTNDRFVMADGSYGVYSGKCDVISNEYPDVDPFPWDQSTWPLSKPRDYKRTIVYGENSAEGSKGPSFAIMKDKDDNYFIYKFTVAKSGYWGVNVAKEACYDIDKSVATDFENAEHYLFASNNQTRLLYTVGSKLYVYDYSRQQFFEKDFTDEITYLEGEYCSSSAKDQFLLATYSDVNKGTIYGLRVGGDPDKCEVIENPGAVWKTRLKVRDIEWKNTNR